MMSSATMLVALTAPAAILPAVIVPSNSMSPRMASFGAPPTFAIWNTDTKLPPAAPVSPTLNTSASISNTAVEPSLPSLKPAILPPALTERV